MAGNPKQIEEKSVYYFVLARGCPVDEFEEVIRKFKYKTCKGATVSCRRYVMKVIEDRMPLYNRRELNKGEGIEGFIYFDGVIDDPEEFDELCFPDSKKFCSVFIPFKTKSKYFDIPKAVLPKRLQLIAWRKDKQ